jgi:flagellin
MGLRIQNNIAAMNAQKQLNISNAGLTKSLERLSSGYRINRAADDAAGLAISQSFRAEIASFKVASRNVSEANSLLQVAEGSLDQMGNILTRLKELATQAASGNAADNIEKINAEANELVEEFDRIATSTEYAGRELLTGDLAAGSMTGAVDGASHDADATTTAGSDDYWFGITSSVAVSSISGGINDAVAALADDDNVWDINIAATGEATVSVTTSDGISFTGNIADNVLTIVGMGEDGGNIEIAADTLDTGTVDTQKLTFNNLGLSTVDVDASAAEGTYTFSTSGDNIVLTHSDGTNQSVAAAAGETLDFDNLGISFDLGSEWDTDDLDDLTITVSGTSGSSMAFQIGSLNEEDNRLSVSLSDAQASVFSLTADMLDTQENAQDALDTIDDAISDLTEQRGNIGAYMNRLENASANLETIIENVQSAESVIRDVDMASEMTEFTKNQILMQAGTSMLAQANLAPQSVLSLLG